MAIVDRALQADDPLAPSVDIPVDMPLDFQGGAEVFQNADGSATVQALMGDEMDQMGMGAEPVPHDANLADYLDDIILKELASEVTQNYEDDLQSRQEWEEA